MPIDTPRCEQCLAARLRGRITQAIRPPAPGRLERLVRRSALALAAGVAVSIPLAALPVATPPAEARSVIALPQLQLPTKEPGYQLATTRGEVVPFGTAVGGETDPGKAIVGIARTKSGAGTWTVSSDGGVFTTGDAAFKGSLGGERLNKPIVGIAATPSGRGYWLVSADGGVFAFGDASFRGAAAGERLNSRIVSIAPTPTGRGYWLVAADGGVFAYGDASFRGSAAGERLMAPITSMAPTRTGRGYWLTSADGGVFAYGDALFYGGAVGETRSKVVGISPTRSGKGYWLAAQDGGVFTFGDAPFLGAAAGVASGKVVGIAGGVALPQLPEPEPAPEPAPAPVVEAAPPAPAPAPAPAAPTGTGTLQHRFGYDISWPQCEGPFPVAGYGFMVVGVTGGRPFSQNRCLAYEWQLANSNGGAGSLYVNVASPRWDQDPQAMNGPAGACAHGDLPCQAYNHSANNITDAIAYARSVGADAPMWWIDVEVLNRWSRMTDLNALTVKAAKETLEKNGIKAGVYSTWLQWRKITGDARFGMPVWAAGVPSDAELPGYCTRPEKAFNGGEIWMVQSIPIVFDVNYVCDPMVAHVGSSFAFPAQPSAAPAPDAEPVEAAPSKGSGKKVVGKVAAEPKAKEAQGNGKGKGTRVTSPRGAPWPARRPPRASGS